MSLRVWSMSTDSAGHQSLEPGLGVLKVIYRCKSRLLFKEEHSTASSPEWNLNRRGAATINGTLTVGGVNVMSAIDGKQSAFNASTPVTCSTLSAS